MIPNGNGNLLPGANKRWRSRNVDKRLIRSRGFCKRVSEQLGIQPKSPQSIRRQCGAFDELNYQPVPEIQKIWNWYVWMKNFETSDLIYKGLGILVGPKRVRRFCERWGIGHISTKEPKSWGLPNTFIPISSEGWNNIIATRCVVHRFDIHPHETRIFYLTAIICI